MLGQIKIKDCATLNGSFFNSLMLMLFLFIFMLILQIYNICYKDVKIAMCHRP